MFFIFTIKEQKNITFTIGISSVQVFIFVCLLLGSTLPETTVTASLPLKMDGVGIQYKFLLGFGLFSGAKHVSFISIRPSAKRISKARRMRGEDFEVFECKGCALVVANGLGQLYLLKH